MKNINAASLRPINKKRFILYLDYTFFNSQTRLILNAEIFGSYIFRYNI